MTNRSIVLAASVAALALTACGTRSPDATPAAKPAAVTQVDSIDAVRERFNRDIDKPRVLTILSPT